MGDAAGLAAAESAAQGGYDGRGDADYGLNETLGTQVNYLGTTADMVEVYAFSDNAMPSSPMDIDVSSDNEGNGSSSGLSPGGKMTIGLGVFDISLTVGAGLANGFRNAPLAAVSIFSDFLGIRTARGDSKVEKGLNVAAGTIGTVSAYFGAPAVVAVSSALVTGYSLGEIIAGYDPQIDHLDADEISKFDGY